MEKNLLLMDSLQAINRHLHLGRLHQARQVAHQVARPGPRVRRDLLMILLGPESCPPVSFTSHSVMVATLTIRPTGSFTECRSQE